MTTVIALAGTLSGGVLCSAAIAGPVPEVGLWSVAYATWRFHDAQGQLRAVDIDVTEHRSVTGELTTQASVTRSICYAHGGVVTCLGKGPAVRRVRFRHDLEMSHADVTITFTDGRVVTSSWRSGNLTPDGARTDEEYCIPDGGSSRDDSLTREATVDAHAFGKHWGTRNLVEAYVGLGAGTKPPCSAVHTGS